LATPARRTRGHGGGAGPRDLRQHLELELLLALAGREHATAAAEERVRRQIELHLQSQRAQQLERPLAPRIAPGLHDVGLAEAHDLALVEHLQSRRILGGLAPEHVRAARVDGHAASRQRPARGDRRIHRVARGGREHEIGHPLELAPVLVAARALALLRGLGFGALEGEDAASQMGEGPQIVDLLQIGPRQDRREAELLGPLDRDRAGDEGGEALAHILEVPASTIHAGHARLDQQTTLDELAQERRLVGTRRASAWH